MRLDDINYTQQKLDGIPEPPGTLGPIEFYQGEDVVLDVLLNYDGVFVSPDDWNIEAIVKKNAWAQNTLWTGVIQNGIYLIPPTKGYYRIIIPSEATATFLAGTYWLDVFIHETQARQNGPKNIDKIILRQPFSINYSAASPNPGSKLASSQAEQTYPPPIDATKM